MYARIILVSIVLSLMLAIGFFLLELNGSAVASPDQTPTWEVTHTPPAPPTSPSPLPSATPWLDAPHNSYVQPVLKQEATPTPTRVPGTDTPPPPPTVPSPPGTPTATPVDQDYAPLVIDTASTATIQPTPKATLEVEPTATAAPPPTPRPTEKPG